MYQPQVAQRHICCTLCTIKSATSVMLGYCRINMAKMFIFYKQKVIL